MSCFALQMTFRESPVLDHLPTPVRLPRPGSAADLAESALLLAHPRFREASLASARAAVALYQGNRFLNVVANDRGRFIVALLATALHHGLAGPGGLTAARLKATCAETGLCSPGRARALLALMQWAGYLAPAEQGRLVPTRRLVDMHRERIAPQLATAALVAPEAAPAADRIGEAAVLAGFCLAQCEAFVAGFRFVEHAPALSVFVERNAGLLVLLSLKLVEVGEMPAATASVAALARRFHVSRPHVGRMLRDAEAAGLVRRTGESVRMQPALLAALNCFHAALFRLNAVSAVAGLAWADRRR